MYWLFSLFWWAALCFVIVAVCGQADSNGQATVGAIVATVLFYYLNRLFFRLILRRGYLFWYFLLAVLQLFGLVILADEFVFTNGSILPEIPNAAITVGILTIVLIVNLQVTITKDWFRSVFIEKRLAKTEHQLARVKLNPHFFKNVLNDLYSLVYLKKDEAAQAVIELKELMEYVIYESDVNYISLQKELHAAKQMVNIQKHRLPPQVSINFQLFIEQAEVLVPPMIFFPFLENVFRHADLSSEGALVDVKLRVKNNLLMYRVKSKLAKNTPMKNGPGGIGITTLEARLYESYGLIGYTIDSKQKDGYYYAKLEIFNLKTASDED